MVLQLMGKPKRRIQNYQRIPILLNPRPTIRTLALMSWIDQEDNKLFDHLLFKMIHNGYANKTQK
jgi:hypothetical protein